MSGDDIFGIAKPVLNEETVDNLLNVDWDSVKNKLDSGIIDEHVIVAMNTQKIPTRFDAVEFKKLFAHLYKEYTKNLVTKFQK